MSLVSGHGRRSRPGSAATRTGVLAAALAAVLLVAGCGGGDTGAGTAGGDAGQGPYGPAPRGTPSPTGPAETPEPAAGAQAPTGSAEPEDQGSQPGGRAPQQEGRASGTVVVTAGSEFGTMLFDRAGQAIYLFDKETSARSQCYDACAEAWPPVLTDGEPRARGQVRDRLLGTTERRDGSLQVTYAGHPLYYYAHEGPDEVRCHNVPGFGGLWLVVTPSGDPAD